MWFFFFMIEAYFRIVLSSFFLLNFNGILPKKEVFPVVFCLEPNLQIDGMAAIPSVEKRSQEVNSRDLKSKRSRDLLQALISHHHSLQPDLFKQRSSFRHSFNPRPSIATPTVRNQVVVGEVGLPFQSQRPLFWEPPGNLERSNRVTVSDKDT